MLRVAGVFELHSKTLLLSFYHCACLGQDKLQVSEQHFDATRDCYNRGGWVKFKSICIALFIAVAKDIDAAIAAGNFPEGWY